MPVVLSKAQKEILSMLCDEYLTPKQISKRRQTTLRAVYKTMAKLKDKGVLRGGSIRGFKKGGVPKSDFTVGGVQFSGKLRLHNIQESIQILRSSEKYQKLILSNNKLDLSEITVMLYADSIQVFTQEGVSFYGQSTEECYNAAISFFKRFYGKIENDCGIIIDKDRVLNKKWVRQHIALTESEAAKEANRQKERIVIHDRDDSKERVITDRSFNGNEIEAIHPTKAREDMNRYKKLVDELIHAPEYVGIIDLKDRIANLINLHEREAINYVNLRGTVETLVKEMNKR